MPSGLVELDWVVVAMPVAARTRRGLATVVVAAVLMVLAAGSATGWGGGDRRPAKALRGDSSGVTDPLEVALDSAGNLYVLNAGGGGSVTVYAAGWAAGNTAPIKTLTGPGRFGAGAMAVDSAGNLYVASSDSRTLAIAMYAAGWAGGNTRPAKTLFWTSTRQGRVDGMAVDSAGNLYVTNSDEDGQRNSVLMWPAGWANGDTPPAKILTGRSTRLQFPTAVAFDSVGNMYVTNQGGMYEPQPSVTVYAPGWAGGNTAPTKMLTGPTTRLAQLVNGVAVDVAGNMYVANLTTHSVTMFAAGWASGDTAPTKTLAGIHTGLRGPSGMAIDPAGNLYVASTSNNRVLMFGVNDQTIDLWPIEDSWVGRLAWVHADASSGLPVSLTSLAPQVCTVLDQDGRLQLVSAGTCVIAADQAGVTGEWNPAPRVAETFTVYAASPRPSTPQRPTRPLGLPAQVAASGWTRLVPLPVTTNAGQQATVRATCTPLERVRVPSGDAGPDCRVARSASAVRVWISGQRAVFVRVRIHAPTTPGYSPYTKVRAYRVTPDR
jgi:sugar lactone lactonase YvrE